MKDMYTGFNSKMVRLKVLPSASCTKAGRFQFQNGTIKRAKCLSKVLIKARFNSKMVRLKDGRRLGVDCGYRCFNSKMVRLKVASPILIRYSNKAFQFQNGTIKRTICFFVIQIFILFQFQNGTIKSKPGKMQ